MRVLVALGGNAILQRGEKGTAAEQLANVRTTAKQLVRIAAKGHRMAVTHGNGPQVGDIMLRDELAKDSLPPMPLDVCGAESQGMLGYMLQQGIESELRIAGLSAPVVSLVSQTIVDPLDPAFSNPTKPVGPFYTEAQAANLRAEHGWTVVNDAGRGYRRVVPSPEPVEIVEKDVVIRLFESGMIVISSGGGGVPVVRNPDGSLRGVEAVLDKDRTAALLASTLRVDLLLILTDVPAVYLDYGKPTARPVTSMTPADAETLLEAGQFPPGSMGPKIQSALRFVKRSSGRAVITSLERAEDALEGNAGTILES